MANQVTIESALSPSADSQFTHPHTNVVSLWDSATSRTWIYVVYSDATALRIARSTDGGITYTESTLQATTGLIGSSVWYDRWTPGDTTGNIIHIAACNPATETLIYFSWNASTNSVGATTNVVIHTFTSISGSSTAGDGGTSICKGANGSLYAAAKATTTAGWAVRQSTDSGSTWGDITAQGSSVNTAMNQVDDNLLLMPCSTTDDIMAIEHDNSAQVLQYQIYDDSANSWSSATQIENCRTGSSTAEETPSVISATLDKTTSNIYLVFTSFDAHLLTEKFTVSTGVWSPLAPVMFIRNTEPQSTYYFLRPVSCSIQRDQTNGVLWVWYTVGDNFDAGERNMYSRVSSDDGLTWSESYHGGLTNNGSYDVSKISSPMVMNDTNEGWTVVWVVDAFDDLYGFRVQPTSTTTGTVPYIRYSGNAKDNAGNNIVGAEVAVFKKTFDIYSSGGHSGRWTYQGSGITDSSGNYKVHVINHSNANHEYVALINFDSCRKTLFPWSRVETTIATGTVFANKFTGLTVGDKIYGVEFYSLGEFAFSIRIKAYADSSGSPGSLLGESGSISVPKKSFLEIAIAELKFPTPITVPSGGIVWIAYEVSTTITPFRLNGLTSGTTKTVAHTYGTGPDPFGSATNQTYGLWTGIFGYPKVDASVGELIG